MGCIVLSLLLPKPLARHAPLKLSVALLQHFGWFGADTLTTGENLIGQSIIFPLLGNKCPSHVKKTALFAKAIDAQKSEQIARVFQEVCIL